MKRTYALCLLSAIIFSCHAQQPKADCDCPKPIEGKFVQIEIMVENQDLDFDKALMKMACADPKKDSPGIVKEKVKCMWEKYYAEFQCNSTGFMVAGGNILKYAVNQEFEYFVDIMVTDFNINVNRKDPSDGKTLLDFVLDEINRYKKDPNYQHKPKQLQRIYDHLKNDFKAKHASEL